jgi:hypothetical protein
LCSPATYSQPWRTHPFQGWRYGRVVVKFQGDAPLWSDEITAAKVIYPYRFDPQASRLTGPAEDIPLLPVFLWPSLGWGGAALEPVGV